MFVSLEIIFTMGNSLETEPKKQELEEKLKLLDKCWTVWHAQCVRKTV